MSSVPTAAKPLPPKPPTRQQSQPQIATAGAKPRVTSGRIKRGERVGIYGPATVGKSTLAALIKKIGKRPLFLDIEDGTKELDIDRLESVELPTWESIRAAINSEDYWQDHDAIVLDSLTRAQDVASTHLMRMSNVDSLEKASGGYGKGYKALDEEFVKLLCDLDQHSRRGRTVILIMHDFVARVPHPDPSGTDYIRYEPRLYQSDKIQIRNRVVEWLDHLLFIQRDIIATEGKAQGGNTRTIYFQPKPHFLAKSRTLRDPVVFDEDSAECWETLFAVNGK